jgi:hypothetical protein
MQVLTYHSKIYTVHTFRARNVKVCLIAKDSTKFKNEIFLFGAGLNFHNQINYALAMSVWGDSYISIFEPGPTILGITGLLFAQGMLDPISLGMTGISINRIRTLPWLNSNLRNSMDPTQGNIEYLAEVYVRELAPQAELSSPPDFVGLIQSWNLTYASSRNLPILLSTINVVLPGRVEQ